MKWTSRSAAAEPPPETTRLRMTRIPGLCIAPQYVAQVLLLAEGFTDLQYVDVGGVDPYPAFATGKVDLSMAFVPPFLVQVDAGLPIVLLAGIHVGCFELFGTGSVRAIRDLKHRAVAVPVLGSAHHAFVASMVVYVGMDTPEGHHVGHAPIAESAAVLTTGKAEALVGLPPVPQELRARGIGHVIVNSAVDRPWSQYFCCIVASNRDFVRQHPVATKRALRALLKATDICAREPERVAQAMVDQGFTQATLCPPDRAGSPLQPMARVRSRGHGTLLRPAPARGWDAQVESADAHCARNRLAVLERVEEGAEGVAIVRMGSSGC